jgi:hypothetical protein
MNRRRRWDFVWGFHHFVVVAREERLSLIQGERASASGEGSWDETHSYCEGLRSSTSYSEKEEGTILEDEWR